MPYRTRTLLLQPTARQSASLGTLVDGQRELYNAALEERRGAWRWERRSVSRREQSANLTGMDHPMLRFGVHLARGTLLRLDRAFADFYRRARAGGSPGFPRFRSSDRWDSAEWPDNHGWKVADGRLYVQGVGHIRFRASKRVPQGTPKTLVVRREGRRWRASAMYEVATAGPLPRTGRSVGLDRGVVATVATSDGLVVEAPRHHKVALDRLAVAQQALARKQRGSRRRTRARERVATLHRRVARQRRDHLHKVSRRLVDTYDLLVIEDLTTTNMTRRPKPRAVGDGTYEPNGAAAKAGLNRSILDSGWGILESMLAYKAEEAGRQLVRVPPHHTSQTCAACGHVAAGNRVSQAEFRCQACGHEAHADVNAAINILRLGRSQQLQAA